MKFKKILIGVDDSKYADNAAQYGFELAHQFKAEVALVHIVEPVVTTPLNDTSMLGSLMPNSLSSGVDEVEIMTAQQEYSKKMIADTANKYAGDLLVTQFNELGSTADSIIDCAAKFNADLIVLGTHGRSGLDRFFMGSVAESVVRHSPVAVLVVPMNGEE